MSEETRKVLEWIVRNNEDYIEALRSKNIGEESIYTAQVCLRGVQQFLDNPNMINNL